MFDKIEIMTMAQAMATHAAARQTAVAENVANADTPGYRAKDVMPFGEAYVGTLAPPLRTTRPGHLGAGVQGYAPEQIIRPEPGTRSPNGNTVALENEMVKAAEVKRDHDLALAIYKTTLTIARASLGR